MNHGYCKNCYYYLNGICWQQHRCPTPVRETSYCPDYGNRKKWTKVLGELKVNKEYLSSLTAK